VTDVLAYSFANTLPSAVARRRAYEATGRALALNPQLSRGYSVLALLQMLDNAHVEAIASARKAVALSPNSAEANLNLAVVLVFAGAPEEALQAMETVLRLDPNPPRHVHDYYGLVLYMNHRYAEAIEVLEKGENVAKSDFGLETLAAANARIGRMDEARDAIETLLERWPGHSLASVRVAYAHHAREEDLAHRLDALRLAGLSEWPYGFQGDPEHRLKGDAIDALTFGRTWIGERTGFGSFMQYTDAKGAFVERGPSHRLAGTASRKGDLLCLETPGVLLGRPHCGPIYRNPGGTPESQDEYIYLNAYLAKRFTTTP
jgi:tetratricopeptide (TPR) repeat protein